MINIYIYIDNIYNNNIYNNIYSYNINNNIYT